MNIRHLRVFNEVCRQMNMTRASEILHISQPAISKTISELESWYGTRLFERWNKNIYLTPTGQMLYDYSLHIVSLLDKLEQEIKGKMREDIIRVGASITAGTSILSDIVTGFQKDHPCIRVEAVIDNTKVIEDLLLKNQLDIGMVEGTIRNQDIVAEVFGRSEIVLVCGRLHPLYGKTPVTREDLEGRDFIVREEGSNTRAKFAAAMRALDIHWNPVWVCHNTQSIKNAVSAGLGIGVLSKLSVRKRLAGGRFFELSPFDAPLWQDFKIAYHVNKYMTRNLINFKSYITEKFNEMESEGYYQRARDNDEIEHNREVMGSMK